MVITNRARVVMVGEVFRQLRIHEDLCVVHGLVTLVMLHFRVCASWALRTVGYLPPSA